MAHSPEVRNAVSPRSALPGPSRAHFSTRLPTHFHLDGLLWHILRKCVTLFRPEVPYRPPPGRIPRHALQRTSIRTAFCGAFCGSAYSRSGPNLPSRSLQGTFLLPPFNALPPGRPSVAHFAEVRNAVPARICLPGPSGAHSSSRPSTHFHLDGLLWHISRKCVTQIRPEEAFQVSLGHLSEQKWPKSYSWLPSWTPRSLPSIPFRLRKVSTARAAWLRERLSR